MKIAIVANTSWYIYKFRVPLMKSLRQAGHEIIFAPVDEYTRYLKSEGFEFSSLEFSQSGVNVFAELAVVWKLHKLLIGCRPDVVLTYTPKPNIYAPLATRFMKTVVINNISGLGRVFTKNSLMAFFISYAYRVSLSKSVTIFVQNPDDFQFFKKRSIAGIEKLKLLPGSGVNLDKFYVNNTNFSNKKGFEFIFVGRLIEEKGIRILVQALQDLLLEGYSISCKVLGQLDGGEGSIKEAEISEWSRLGVIHYVGYEDDIRHSLWSADCFVFPSYYGEGVPRAALEAASCGLPIITTDSVGCREVIVDGYNGFTCEPRSRESLLLAMKKVLSLSVNERMEMSSNSRRLVEQKFSEKIVIEAYHKALSQIDVSQIQLEVLRTIMQRLHPQT